jgi:uncharacterized protein YbaR (Trm112 family)
MEDRSIIKSRSISRQIQIRRTLALYRQVSYNGVNLPVWGGIRMGPGVKLRKLQTNTAMINKELLDILVCPELRTPLTMADDELLAALNRAVAEGRLKNRGGERVTKPLDGGLVREDREVVYPIQDGIPIMLVDEAIPLDQVTERKA